MLPAGRTSSAEIGSERSALVRNRKEGNLCSTGKNLSDLGDFISNGECSAVKPQSLGCSTVINHPQLQPLRTTRFLSHPLHLSIAVGHVLCSACSSLQDPR